MLFLDTTKQPIAILSGSIPLHDDFKSEHDDKLFALKQNIGCVSPYLSFENAIPYAIHFKSQGQLVDIENRELEDGRYLLTITGEAITESPWIINPIMYASIVDSHHDDEILSSYPATLPKVLNHPNFIRGENVVFSGHIIIQYGTVIKLDNESGHYKPTLENCLPAIAWIYNQSKSECLEFIEHPARKRYTIEHDSEHFQVNLDTDEIVFSSSSEPSCSSDTNRPSSISPSLSDGYEFIGSSPSQSRHSKKPLQRQFLFFNSPARSSNSQLPSDWMDFQEFQP